VCCGVSGVSFIDLAGYSSGVSSLNITLHYFVSNLGVRRYTICILAGSSHISSQCVGRMIRSWTEAINLKGQYGAHTLRKTWGYMMRVHFGVGYELICKRYNHSSPVVTMRYLGIESKEVTDMLMNVVG